MPREIRVKNPTKSQIAMWWGHTPYVINPDETLALPYAVAKDCLKHKDYQKLEIIDDVDFPTEPEVELAAPKPKLVPETNFWDNEDWDPMSAPEEELKAYADAKGMIWNEDIAVMRDAVYERLMEQKHGIAAQFGWQRYRNH